MAGGLSGYDQGKSRGTPLRANPTCATASGPSARLRQNYQMPRCCSSYSAKRNTLVQGHEASSLPDSQRQQVGIGDMPGTQYTVPHQAIRIEQTDGIGPEYMRGVLRRLGKSCGHLRSGNPIGVARL